jgi:hypothetical protein
MVNAKNHPHADGFGLLFYYYFFDSKNHIAMRSVVLHSAERGITPLSEGSQENGMISCTH